MPKNRSFFNKLIDNMLDFFSNLEEEKRIANIHTK